MAKNYQIVTNQADFVKALDYLDQNEYAAFDIETNSAEESRAKVIGLSFSCQFDEAYYLVLREWDTTRNELISLYAPELELKLINKLCEILLRKKLIMHNGVYDTVVMWHQYEVDLVPALYCDTILLKHTIDEEHPFGLKDLANKYAAKLGFGEDEIANQEQLDLKEAVIKAGGKWTKKQKDIYKGPALLVGKYGAADADLTLKVFDYLEQGKLRREKLEDFFYEKEVMPLYKHVTIPMKMHGIYVDVPYFQKLKKEIEDGILSLTDEVFRLISDVIEPKIKAILDAEVNVTKTGTFAIKALQHYGIDPIFNDKTGKPTLAKKALQSLAQMYPGHFIVEFMLNGTPLPEKDVYAIKREIYLERHPDSDRIFNLNSTKHLAWLLFDAFKCKPKDFSRKTGAPKVDKNSLHEFDLPFIPTLAKLKKEEKILNTYVIPILEKQQNGWLYPSMLQFGTTSGRYSCAGGLNLQTLPRDDKRIKKGFIAPQGYKVVNADFSSLEPRIFSWVSKDPGLKDIWLKGLDMYSKIAIDVFQLENVSALESDANYLKKVDPDYRQKSKVFTLAVPYGANAFRIAQLMGIEPEEAQEIIDAYLSAYPYLKDYMENQELLARTEGKVWTEFGRIRHLPMAKDLWEEFGELILNKLEMALEFAGKRGWDLYSEYRRAKKLKDKESREYAKELREEILKLGNRGVELYYTYRNLMNNAKNFPIQSTAAHVCNAALIKLAQSLKDHDLDAKIVLSIHDEITCLASEKDAPKCAELLKDAMEHNWVTDEIDIPMLADPLIADNFSDAK